MAYRTACKPLPRPGPNLARWAARGGAAAPALPRLAPHAQTLQDQPIPRGGAAPARHHHCAETATA
eukprot:8555987-Lingulodinium_polyedra.AAC.1